MAQASSSQGTAKRRTRLGRSVQPSAVEQHETATLAEVRSHPTAVRRHVLVSQEEGRRRSRSKERTARRGEFGISAETGRC